MPHSICKLKQEKTVRLNTYKSIYLSTRLSLTESRSSIRLLGRRKKKEGQNLEIAFKGDTSRETIAVSGPKCSLESSPGDRTGDCPWVA